MCVDGGVARLFCVRDPHGERADGGARWRGDWSARSPRWTPELRRACEARGRGLARAESDGGGGGGGGGGALDRDWIELKDLMMYFERVTVCEHRPRWSDARVGVARPAGGDATLAAGASALEAELLESSEVTAMVAQPPSRALSLIHI